MRYFPKGRRAVLAGLVAAAAIGSAAPAQADGVGCDERLDGLVAQFYDMADRRGYDVASEWWQARWHAYHQSCVLH